MDFLIYFVFSAVYVMIIHFAIAIDNEFDYLWWMAMYFGIGAVIGWYFQSYPIGFVVGVVLSLILW